MSYAEVSVVWEGALDDTFEVTEDINNAIEQYATATIEQAYAQGEHAEVYVLWHDHAQGVECECVQYLTDHSPDYHTHLWGPVEYARLTGNPNRACVVRGCRQITLHLEDGTA